VRRPPTRSCSHDRSPPADQAGAARARLDVAAVPNVTTPGVFDPPTCQHAPRQAKRLAKNLRGKERPYECKSLGSMATLGRRHGIATLGALRLLVLLGCSVARVYRNARGAGVAACGEKTPASNECGAPGGARQEDLPLLHERALAMSLASMLHSEWRRTSRLHCTNCGLSMLRKWWG
jgi:hypothetical protein